MDGILPLNKPAGWTSHDCVMKTRKLFKTKKAGHTGTLDPDVTGVLPICIGRATKVVEYLTGAEKTYEGEVTLGTATETEDASGKVIEQQKIKQPVKREQIIEAMDKLTGEINQVPPMYSAVKVNGKRLYEYAREGIEVERPNRNITVYEFKLLDDREQFAGESISFTFRVKASKGTYVRTLAVDLGRELGYPAHMSHLIRTASGPFDITECLTFEQIEAKMKEGTAHDLLMPIERALAGMPSISVSAQTAEKVKNGALLPEPENMEDSILTVKDPAGAVLAVYKKHPLKKGVIKPEKVLRNE
ncbi:tRNA pseudouridine(55) synthase TruB [Bacillus marinisedimentorum]|uniref:tRNA pseudouridine(55) synthase TruB n=1 Tax=Bacillus marinisedimentorum TaxID=1821260 RepID=UPI0007E1ACD3|nr:tRNA pseudouridine(55) synthase TruB [Bacillus marinisedimentorum]